MAIALGIIAGLVLVDLVFSHAWLAWGIARRAPRRVTPERWPSVSVVRPSKGAEPGQEENFRAALETGYPGEVETIFVFDDADDPGYAVGRRVVEAHAASGRPGTARVMLAGEPPAQRTGKLHAMIVGGEHARGELLAFGDSDTRPGPGLLTELVETLLADERVGCTFAPAVVASRLRTPGDVGYAVLLNSMYGSAAARAAGPSGDLPFIMGQIMLFRREALGDVGGVACAEGQLVDDMAIGRCLHAAGWRNVMVKGVLPIVIDGIGFRRFLAIYRRWMLFGRNGLSIRFTWPIVARAVECFIAWALLVVSVAVGAWWGWGLSLAAIVAYGWSNADLHRRLGGRRVPLAGAWMLWGTLLLAPGVYVTMVRAGVDWRGRSYSLGRKASLRGAGG